MADALGDAPPPSQGHADAAGGAGKSKKALKREQRYLAAKEHRQEKKRGKKEEARLARELLPPKPAREARVPLRHEPVGVPRAERNRMSLQSLDRSCLGTLIIDVDFESLMTDGEKRSMVKQIAYCYSANRYAPRPFNIEVRGLNRSTLMGQGLLQLNCEEWMSSCMVCAFEEGGNSDGVVARVLGSHPKESVVYLSPDAEEVLDRLDPSRVYVIGGFVDRNRHKGASAERAKLLEVSSARLPLESFALATQGFSRVLTTNHVVDVMLEVNAGGEWNDGFARCLPKRKLKEDSAAPADAALASKQPLAEITRSAVVMSQGLGAQVLASLRAKGWSVLALGAPIPSSGVASMPINVHDRGDTTRAQDVVKHRFPWGVELLVLVCAPNALPSGVLLDLLPLVHSPATRIAVVPSEHPDAAEAEWTEDVLARMKNAMQTRSLDEIEKLVNL